MTPTVAFKLGSYPDYLTGKLSLGVRKIGGNGAGLTLSENRRLWG
jgi:hypothetical protein